MAPGEIERRFWDKVTKADNCWLFNCTNGKYGHFRIGKNTVPAHRYSYELHYGPIPKGLFVCHKCDVMPCVKPKHLFLGTHQDNVKDMVKKGRATRLVGENNPMAKLTYEKVSKLRLVSKGKSWHQKRAIAKEFGIGEPHLYEILSGKYWKPRPTEDA